MLFFLFFKDQFCNPVTVNYTGFNVTWNETLVGRTVEVPCSGPGLNGNYCMYGKFQRENCHCVSQSGYF